MIPILEITLQSCNGKFILYSFADMQIMACMWASLKTDGMIWIFLNMNYLIISAFNYGYVLYVIF